LLLQRCGSAKTSPHSVPAPVWGSVSIPFAFLNYKSFFNEANDRAGTAKGRRQGFKLFAFIHSLINFLWKAHDITIARAAQQLEQMQIQEADASRG
jgi:hypothetical protein